MNIKGLRKKSKGFTMVEMLAAVVIMGILASIGIVSVIHIRANQKAKFNQSQTEIFRQTAKNYFTDNKRKLPAILMTTERIYLEELIKNNYLDELLDYDKESYNIADSYVEVRKLGSDAYVYNPVLYENGKDEPIKYDDGDKPGEVKILAYIVDSQQGVNLGCKLNNTKKLGCTGKGDENAEEYYTNGDIRVNISASDPDNIYLYRYYIYKNDKVIKISDFIEIPESQRITGYKDEYISLNKDEYSDGIYKIKYVVYDLKGHKNTATSKKIYIDTTKPSCRATKTPNVVWANKDVKVEGICSDSGSGCLGNYSQKYTTEMNKDIPLGTVMDAAGNKTQCGSISVKIDKTAPKCNVSGESTSYIKGTRTISTTCSENGSVQSGCVSSKVDHKYSTTASTASLNETVKDAAGNTTVCKKTVSVYVDNTPPTCTSSGGSANWRTSAFYIKGTCSDANSKCRGNVQLLISTEQNTTNVSPGTVCDNVGNCTQCPANQIARLDLNAPSITCSASMSNGSNGVDGYNFWVYATDSMSGMRSYTRNPGNNLKNSQTYTVYDNAGRSASCSINISSYAETRHRNRYAKTETYKCGTTTSYGSWSKGSCYKYSSGIHGNYEYTPNTNWSGGHGAACTGTGLSAAKRRRVYVTDKYCSREVAWGGWSGWSTAGCANSDTNNCEYRTNYNASVS